MLFICIELNLCKCCDGARVTGCTAGFYVSWWTSSTLFSCTMCTSATWSPAQVTTSGTTTCGGCAAGYFVALASENFMAPNCLPCPTGSYSNATETALVTTTCSPCPPGSFCGNGLYCPSGYICDNYDNRDTYTGKCLNCC